MSGLCHLQIIILPSPVILNEVKDLWTQSECIQILHFVQNDKMRD